MDTLKRRMEQLINGRFEYEVPELILSNKEIVIETKVGENYRGELFVGAADNRRIKGMVMSSDRRLLLAKEKFSGTAVCIVFGVDVKGLSAGDSMHAFLTINSNIGEYKVPVTVNIQEKQIKASSGEVKNLNDFVKLAEEDFREAFRLYTSDAFLGLLQGVDKKYLGLYKGMSQNPVTYQHMEEFLIGIDKKQPVFLQLDKKEKKWENMESTIKDTLYLYKSNWGYTCLEIEVRGDFLDVEKRVVTSEDFIGSVYGLEYFIKKEKLGTGKKYGQIQIHTVYETLIFDVTASAKHEYVMDTGIYEKKALLNVVSAYKRYRLEMLHQEEWKDITLRELERLKNLGYYAPKYQLMEAFIYYENGNIPKTMAALWPLRDVTFTKEQMEEEAVYLALAVKTGVATDQQRELASSRIETLYQINPRSRILLDIYLKYGNGFTSSNTKKMYLLEQLYEYGCTSPFLYLDAYEMLAKEESLLKKLSPFMVQVLSYAAKYGKLTGELTLRIGHLTEYVKTFQPLIYRLLVSCYDAFPGKGLLIDICKYIMKGQPRNKAYFKWFALAVEQDVRITGLYEHYIETMPKGFQDVLPQVIRMYFVYNNAFSSTKRASVYANVIRNKEIDKTTYHSYRKGMEQFALEALRAGYINEDYALIYQECIDKLTNTSIAQQLASVMYTYRLYCDDAKIRKVIVCYEQLEKEEEYPCTDGIAYIQLFDQSAKIIFEDGKRRRYISTVEYNLQKMMDVKEYQKQCMGLNVSYYGLLLAVCESGEKLSVRNLGCYQQVMQRKEFCEEYRHLICKQILEYYAAHAGDDTLDGYLRNMDYLTFARVDKVLLTELLIEKGLYEIAFEIIKKYGYEGIKVEALVKMTSRMILRTEFVEQEELVYLALYVFEQNKYDDVILTYLSDNLLGSVQQMESLWRKMKGFQLDTYALEEEIMLLAMYGRVHLVNGHEILKNYVQQKGKYQVILAYLSFCAYEYFLGGQSTDAYIFQCLELCVQRNLEVDIICRLALLKYYSKQETLNEMQDELAKKILEECNEKGLRFAFYQKLPERYTKPYQLDDKQFVEVKYPSDAKVIIHYCMTKNGEKAKQYKSEPMRNMYQGIFVKEFLLFYGETLWYYLTIENAGEENVTEEQTLCMQNSFQEGKTKYQLLNQMLSGQKLGQYKQIDEAMQQYLARERLAEKLFMLVE